MAAGKNTFNIHIFRIRFYFKYLLPQQRMANILLKKYPIPRA